MQPITDFRGQLIGYIREEFEKTFIHDRSYNALGYYSNDFNKTFYMNGTPVGNGNLLSMLLND